VKRHLLDARLQGLCTVAPLAEVARNPWARAEAAPKSASRTPRDASALAEAGLCAGDRAVVEPVGDGELRVRRAEVTFDTAFGALTGIYPEGYLEQLDAEERER